MNSKRVLVIFGTTEGHTGKIANHVGAFLRDCGHTADVFDATELPTDLEVNSYDAYILAGSLHMGEHQPGLVSFALKHVNRFRYAPTAFLSVSLSAAHSDEKAVASTTKCIDRFLDETGWRPTMTTPVAGALMYSKYNFLVKMMMRKIAKKEGGPTDTSCDHELTDWVALDRFLGDFLDHHAAPLGDFIYAFAGRA